MVVLEPPVVLEPVVLLIINLSDVWIDMQVSLVASVQVSPGTDC